MKIFWETQCWPGASISPGGVACLTWIPQCGGSSRVSTAAAPPPPVANAPVAPTTSSATTAFSHDNQTTPSKTRGYLAVGTDAGVVGITLTDTADERSFETADLSRRYNYNLRGHHSRVQRCAWNARASKLASCDTNGVIMVWIPNEERWSVELINDRGLKVRDFDWSAAGQAALIIYEDSFILVGSSTGQRIWSQTFLYQVNCGNWAPTSREFVLGLDSGAIQLFTETGTLITERQLVQVPIRSVAFSPVRADADDRWTLAVVSAADQILFINTFYEVELRSWQSNDVITSIHWSGSGRYLAVVRKTGSIVILNSDGRLVHEFTPPLPLGSGNLAFTWAHGDECLIVAAGGTFAVGRVREAVPALGELIAYQTWLALGRTARNVRRLALPERANELIRGFDRHIIRSRIPSYDRMCRFVCEPTFFRWYCTIQPVPKRPHHYLLCMEHAGGIVPLLVGRQINRVIPQFVISLPPSTAYSTPGFSRGRHAIAAGEHTVGVPLAFAAGANVNLPVRNAAFTADLERVAPPTLDDPVESAFSMNGGGSSEVASIEETRPLIGDETIANTTLAASTPLSRATMWRRSKRQIKKFVSSRLSPRSPKSSRVLCQVRSNVWCTRFKITAPGICDLPQSLAHVVYKTSVLHLQPRQMTISLCDLRPLTKTLPLPTRGDHDHRDIKVIRQNRSAGSSPRRAISRPTRRLNNPTDDRLLLDDDDESEDEAAMVGGEGMIAPVGDATLLPPVYARVAAAAVAAPQPPPQRFMTYAETRARLRARRHTSNASAGDAAPLAAAVPVAAVPPPQQPAELTGRQRVNGRARRSALRYFRRAAEHHQQLQAAAAATPPARRPQPPAALITNIATPAAIAADEDDEMLNDERRLYALVLSEFRGLCSAVSSHVARMRGLADELEAAESAIAAPPPSRRQTRSASTPTIAATTIPATSTIAPPHSARAWQTRWQTRVDSLDFIDAEDVDDEFAHLDTNEHDVDVTAQLDDDRRLLLLGQNIDSPADHTIRLSQTSPTDKTIVDRLAALAADFRLTRRSKSSAPLVDEPTAIGMNENREPTTFTTAAGSSTATAPDVDEMRAQLRRIARQLAQIDETLRPSDQFVDLRQRVARLKTTLGESPSRGESSDIARLSHLRPTAAATAITTAAAATVASNNNNADETDEIDQQPSPLDVQSERGASPTDSIYGTIRMANKSPLWNEDSQVYQLDFGGRVTQESAKNFQVLQFGRIEGGAYTLDFCSPLSAVQAFGIALASITQRLK